ncbi:MAG: hypothetical protein COU35_01195 [Candidatus Magasanikbacteria bacterium CG10_big_fil_rev_8_21_14_0_10_47_10]|uniref:Gluconeogenesis factor n=1 Tax=Candidatus Magasanikbacteria bacterium CG10_big_fil_rev_8_21_14_0_10_47_10 TaxID=1974652 RepID=A0A2H0TRA3_9BACT|nr:MAG: hypothetical protein COU35_01195 [Candidatus Magasanikbacteria bacterium CG10_big_fil_rev_8_21_14_0_10_47_10]
MKKKVVVFGGGNGSAMMMRALKRHTDVFDTYAVVSMSDSGGSSGRLREEFNTLPPGDILRAVLASSKYSYKEFLKPLFYGTRFDASGKLSGHNLGNLFLTLGSEYAGAYMDAINALSQAVEAQGTVYPATLTPNNLVATLQDGSELFGEHAIDRPGEQRSPIMEVRLEPHVDAFVGCLSAIEQSDFLMFGPGSLYCSVVASVLPKGIRDAIEKSNARLVYVAGDIYELEGEAGPTALSEFVRQLEQYVPRKIDSIIFNGQDLSEKQAAYYKEKMWGRLTFDRELLSNYDIIDIPFEKEHGGLDPEKLGLILRNLVTSYEN